MHKLVISSFSVLKFANSLGTEQPSSLPEPDGTFFFVSSHLVSTGRSDVFEFPSLLQPDLWSVLCNLCPAVQFLVPLLKQSYFVKISSIDLMQVWHA